MYEFNPDGSLKIPTQFLKQKEDNENRMKRGRCIKIKRDLVSVVPPKSCDLILTLSDVFLDESFVQNIFDQFKKTIDFPVHFKKIESKSYIITIGTSFRRCTSCQKLIGLFREYVDGNLIEERGRCTFEPRAFNYEDHFE
jgi:hypothetical protein